MVLDELNLKVTDKRKLLEYASKFPIPVQQTLQLAPWKGDSLEKDRSIDGHVTYSIPF